MMVSPVSTPPHVAPTQVWARGPTELPQRTIQLLTRLAVNWVVAQSQRSDPEPSSQEVTPALPHHTVSDLPRTSGAAGLHRCPAVHVLPGA
jgi:hypothetical protein